MKRIIGGKTYNTDTSSIVARYEYERAAGAEVEVTVYQTRGGALFEVRRWQERVDGGYGPPEYKARAEFEPMDREALVRLVAETDGLEIIDNTVLEDPPEATAETKPEAVIFVRVPASLKQRLDDEARVAGQSANAFAARCLERCLQASAEGRKDG